MAGDLESVVAIYNAAVADGDATADIEPVTPESRRRWLLERSYDRRPVWVCESGGAITAWLAFQDFYGRPAYDRTAEVGVYVHPEHRRRGLGAALLRRALGSAPSMEVETLLGFVFAQNTPSISLFTSVGFEEWGRLPRVARMPDGEQDVLILGRRMPEPHAGSGERSLIAH